MSKRRKQKVAEQPQTRLEKAKPYLEPIVACIAVASFFLSIRGCWDTAKANRTAEEALQTSRQQFIQLNRPYVTLRLTQYDDGHYWKLSGRGNAVVISLRYEMRNVGNVAAKDLSLQDRPPVVGTLNEGVPVIYMKPGKLTLGPGDSFFAEASLMIGRYAGSNSVAEAVKHLTSAEHTGLEFELSVDYENEVDDSQTYRTLVQNRVFQDKAQLIKSEMFVLSDEALQSEKNSTPIQ